MQRLPAQSLVREGDHSWHRPWVEAVVDEGLARPQQLRRLVGTALWTEELRKPCDRTPHGPSQWPKPFVVQAQAVHAPAATQYGSPKGIAVPPPANGASGPRCMPVAFRCCLPPRVGHAKFMPSFVIIAMGDSSTGPSQDLSPSMASGAIGTCRRVAVLAAWMAERDI